MRLLSSGHLLLQFDLLCMAQMWRYEASPYRYLLAEFACHLPYLDFNLIAASIGKVMIADCVIHMGRAVEKKSKLRMNIFRPPYYCYCFIKMSIPIPQKEKPFDG